jgi:hypothetical protein
MIATITLFLLALRTFTIQAALEQSQVIALPAATVRGYYADLSVYKRHFPGIVNTRRVSATESLWTYEMDPPLAPKKRTTYRLIQSSAGPESVVFKTADGLDDFMLCRATVVALSDSTTKVTIGMELRMTRESGSDFHFLAPIVGQNFISEQMRKQVAKDLDTFFDRTSSELYRNAGR